MKPCPRCKHTVSLQDLQHELALLEWRKRVSAGEEWSNSVAIGSASSSDHTHSFVRGTIAIGNGAVAGLPQPAPPVEKIPTDTVTCASCGLNWTPSARDFANDLIAKIRAIKIELSPIEAIGDLARP
jgi:hypothetical protein